MRTLRRLAVPLVLASVLGACGRTPEPVVDEVPVAVAEPVPFSATGLVAPTAPARSRQAPSPSPSPTPGSEAPSIAADRDTTPAGPTSADAAAFLRREPGAGVTGREHVVVDLDGDGWDEVVATGMRGRRGVVTIAWWTSGGYEVLASDEAGQGSRIADLRAADVNQDGTTDVLVAVEGDGMRSLALWAVPGRGELVPLEAVGGCHDGSHVYGVTHAWLERGGDGPPAVVADCDESPLPVADWADHRWAWEDGAYRHVAPPPPDDGGDRESPGGDAPGKGPSGDGPPGRDRPGDGPPDRGQGGSGDGDEGGDDGDGDDDGDDGDDD